MGFVVFLMDIDLETGDEGQRDSPKDLREESHNCHDVMLGDIESLPWQNDARKRESGMRTFRNKNRTLTTVPII